MRGGRAAFLLLVVWLVGCAAKTAYKQGLELEAAGDVVGASERYLAALDARATFEEPRMALEGLAEQAWHVRLARAEEAEKGFDFVEAGTRYKALLRYQRRLEGHGLLAFVPTVDAEAKVAEMARGAAQREYALAEQALAEGSFAEAIAGYQRALSHVPDFHDAQEKIGATWLAWGDALVDSGDYRTAVERYDGARDAGDDLGAMRAAEVLAALGRYHLAGDACRQAVRDLEAADARYPGAVDEELDQAQRCAEVRVAVDLDPLSRRDRLRYEDVDVTSRLEGLIEAGVPDATSPHVRLVEKTRVDGPERGPDGEPTVHEVVAGKVVSGEIVVADPSASEERTRAQADVECIDEETGKEDTCLLELDVRYTLHVEVVQARLSASLRVVAFPEYAVLDSATFDASARDEIRYATDLRDMATGLPLDASAAGYLALRLPSDLEDLVAARHEPLSDATLYQQATDALAGQAVPWIAEVVDAEEQAVDPAVLEIEALPQRMQRPR